MRYVSCILIAGFLTGCYSGNPPKRTGLEGKAMPSFNLLLLDSTTQINTNQIPQGKPIVFYLFATWCPYCKAQTEELISKVRDLEGINFYMICNEPLSSIKAFSGKYGMQKFPEITIGMDEASYLASYLRTNVVPLFAIYDKEKKLQAILEGKSSLEVIQTIALGK